MEDKEAAPSWSCRSTAFRVLPVVPTLLLIALVLHRTAVPADDVPTANATVVAVDWRAQYQAGADDAISSDAHGVNSDSRRNGTSVTCTVSATLSEGAAERAIIAALRSSLPVGPARAALSQQLVVAAGDSLGRGVINALRDATDGGQYAKRPENAPGVVRPAPRGKRGRSGRGWVRRSLPRFLYENHLLHGRDGNIINRTVAGAAMQIEVYNGGRPGLLIISFGRWYAAFYGDPPSVVYGQIRGALAWAAQRFRGERSSALRASRIVVYVPHCEPPGMFKKNQKEAGCFAGKRGDAYRRAVACAAASVAAEFEDVRVDVYDPCDWVLHGDVGDGLGSTTDGLHFRNNVMASVVSDFAARFATAAALANLTAEDGDEKPVRRALAWGSDEAPNASAVVAAIDDRYRCVAADFDRFGRAPPPSPSPAAERTVTSNASIAQPVCSLHEAASAHDVAKLGWDPTPGCSCAAKAPQRALSDACEPSYSMLIRPALFRPAQVGASLCALRGPRARCPHTNLTGLDLDGALAPGNPAFEEALLTICAAPEAYGLCLQNLGAGIGNVRRLTRGSAALRSALLSEARIHPSDADSVCRCGFEFQNTSAINATAGRWCQNMRLRIERARYVFYAARETLNTTSATEPLGCDMPTLQAMDMCTVVHVRAAVFLRKLNVGALRWHVGRKVAARAKQEHRWLKDAPR